MTPSFRITVCDQHNEYQILSNNQILHHFRKRKDSLTASVTYDADYTVASTLSNTIPLFTENDVDGVAWSDCRARPDIWYVPLLEKSVHNRYWRGFSDHL